MGGTFNPPHKAHIELAKAAYREFSLDKVVFMTDGNPPHKKTGLDAKIRHHMVKLAIEEYSFFEACDYEIKKDGYSYTADTLVYLNTAHPDDTFYFIIGGDSFQYFLTWHKPEIIIKNCVLLVYPRDGFPRENDISDFNKKYNADAHILSYESFDISSGEVRKMAENGEDFGEYLCPEVYEYIKRNNLYKRFDGTWEEHLKKLLKPSRYEHSLGVAAAAVTMAGIFGADPYKAYAAGLLHDCAKNLTSEENEIKCRDLEVEIDEFEIENPGLIHAKVGAELVKTEFGISDAEICNAIKWHTLGRVGMGKLEKIIFVADMVEKNRNYPGVESLRRLAHSDLDSAVLECVSRTIAFNKEKGRPVHPNAYAVFNWLVSTAK